MLRAISLLLLSTVPEPASDPAIDLLIQKAQEVQQQDLRAWARFRFERRVTRERFDGEGEVKFRQLLEFIITPEDEGFDELLVRIDGEEPKASEVREHRKKARFTERYHQALVGEEPGEGGEDFSLFRMLYLGEQRYSGRETIDGVPCHRIEFSPPEEPEGGSIGTRIRNAMDGILWVTLDGLHLFRVRAWIAKPVSAAIGLVRVRELHIELETVEVEAGIWLPRWIRIRSEARVIGFSTRRRNTFEYEAYVSDRSDPAPDSP